MCGSEYGDFLESFYKNKVFFMSHCLMLVTIKLLLYIIYPSIVRSAAFSLDSKISNFDTLVSVSPKFRSF